MRINFFDGRREFDTMKHELVAAACRVLESGQYILGEEVIAFEDEAAAYLGAKHAIGVASGTDALTCTLRALGIQSGDLVLTTSYSFFATAASILSVGALPVFADIDPQTLNLSPAAARAVISGESQVHRDLGVRPECIKAIMPVHLFGLPADLDALGRLSSEFGVPLIEDAAQAFGSRLANHHVGTIGDAGCYSFFPTKGLGGFGDGGMVVTDSDALAERVRLVRAHGSREKYVHSVVGMNSRLDAIQAALLRVRLRRLPESLRARIRIASIYDDAFVKLEQLHLTARPRQSEHTFHQYVVRTTSARRDSMRSGMAREGIETAIHYPIPLHLQPALRFLGYGVGSLPESEEASRSVVSLPIYPCLEDGELEQVIDRVSHLIERAA